MRAVRTVLIVSSATAMRADARNVSSAGNAETVPADTAGDVRTAACAVARLVCVWDRRDGSDDSAAESATAPLWRRKTVSVHRSVTAHQIVAVVSDETAMASAVVHIVDMQMTTMWQYWRRRRHMD